MIRYILLAVVFQVLFLVIYDLFLKRETFFQWNRVYLIGTFLLSLVLPFVKIDAFSVSVSENFSGIVLPEIVLTPNNVSALEQATSITWWQGLLFVGMALVTILFISKIYRIMELTRMGKIERFSDFIKVIVPKSNLAFSFYRTVFLGDAVSEKEEAEILKHELVHIKQKHTLDLLFFELMRIAFWFNPLVYMYQSRISELHEFIADAQVGKNNKKEQYELLLSQVFQTRNISFINHFYKSSLIKKRIVMLQKSKSNQTLKFKYLVMLPLVIGMLFYTSCEMEKESVTELEEIQEVQQAGMIDEVVIVALSDNALNQKTDSEIIEVVEEVPTIEEIVIEKGEKITALEEVVEEMPFSVIEEVPVFPGCENAVDKEKCFNDHMIKHVKKNFRYPEEAAKMGVQGRVNVIFSVKKDGSIGDIRLKGPNKDLEAEARRIISRLPQMTPGKHKGKDISVPYTIPITFKLAQKQK